MFEVTIEDIQKNFQAILEQTGTKQFVDWQEFIQSNRKLDKTLNHLSTCIAHLRQIQHQRFISTMKLIISLDIPAMIKFVKSKRLPASALSNILNWLTIKQNKVQLKHQVKQLKQQSLILFKNFKQNNTKVSTLTNQITFLLSEKIKPLLVLETDNKENAYLKASMAYQNMITNENKVQTNHMPQSVEEQQRSTYSELKQVAFKLIIEKYKRITADARKNRRSLIKNHPQYLKSIIKYLTDTEELIIEGYKTAGDILDLDIEKFQQIELFQKGNDKIMLNTKEQMHEKLKLSPSTQVEVQLAKKIFEFQIELLEERVQFFKDLFSTMEKTSFNLINAGKILMLSLEDIVFEKFNKQEQDFSNYTEQSFLAKNSEVEDLIKRVALKMHEVFQEIGMNQHIMEHQKKNGASFQIYLMKRAAESLQAKASNTCNQEQEEAKID